jgi:hypothetical protein
MLPVVPNAEQAAFYNGSATDGVQRWGAALAATVVRAGARRALHPALPWAVCIPGGAPPTLAAPSPPASHPSSLRCPAPPSQPPLVAPAGVQQGGAAGRLLAVLAPLVALGPVRKEELAAAAAVQVGRQPGAGAQQAQQRLVRCLPHCPLLPLHRNHRALASFPRRYGGLWRTQVLEVTISGRPRPFTQLDGGGGATLRMARILVGDPGGAQTEMVLPFDSRWEEEGGGDAC